MKRKHKWPRTETILEMPLKNAQGELIGHLVQTREVSAAEDMERRKLRKLFRDATEGSGKSWQTPIIGKK